MASISCPAVRLQGISGVHHGHISTPASCTDQSTLLNVSEFACQPSAWTLSHGEKGPLRVVQCQAPRKNQKSAPICVLHKFRTLLSAPITIECDQRGQETCRTDWRTADTPLLVCGSRSGSRSGSRCSSKTSVQCCQEGGLMKATASESSPVPVTKWQLPAMVASWGRQGLASLLAFSLLLNFLDKPDLAAAAVTLQGEPGEVSQSVNNIRISEVVSGLSFVEMPPAGSPDVGQTSLFSAENEDLAADLFEKLSPSVVSIQDFKVAPLGRSGRNVQPEPVIEGQGSGFVWDSYGHIVTNYHVVAKLATDPSNRQRCRVTLRGEGKTTTVYEATLVGSDSNRDIAVLKIDAPAAELQPLPIGTSGDLRVGQSCFAIGNPFGFGQTLTTGVVSGLDRMIPSPSGKPIPGAIQTDAAINSGNSGGPLLDSFGRLIGVNTATFTRQGSGQSSGVNFAIPVDVVYRIVPKLIVNGSLNYENGLKP